MTHFEAMFYPENGLVTSENILTGTCISWQSTFLSSRGNHVKAPSGCREVILSSRGFLVKAPSGGRKVILSSRGFFCQSTFAGSRGNHVIARDEAISPESCHREERGDLGFLPMANNEKRDCRATLAWVCHREERGDLGFLPMANSEREIAALRSPGFVIARDEAISPF